MQGQSRISLAKASERLEPLLVSRVSAPSVGTGAVGTGAVGTSRVATAAGASGSAGTSAGVASGATAAAPRTVPASATESGLNEPGLGPVGSAGVGNTGPASTGPASPEPASTGPTPGSSVATLGVELFSVVALLDANPALRRALTDPSRAGEAKAGLAQRLLAGKVGDLSADVVSGAARDRWSVDRDLGDGLEQLGIQALLASAQNEGQLDRVEDETFRLSRIVSGSRDLAEAFGDRRAGTDQRGDLVDRLLGRKVHPVTLALVRQVVTAPRGRPLEAALSQVLEQAAERRHRLVAVVTAAVPLSEAQRDRLAAALGKMYGRAVLVEVDVDPSVVGGVRVAVGDEVLDSTVVSRLAEARRRLAG